MNKQPLKRYIIRKVVKATSIADALKKEKKIEPEDITRDEDWKPQETTYAIGFMAERPQTEDESDEGY